jgi:antitoxin component YwqK of YwqJK toxin-antitoxin module
MKKIIEKDGKIYLESQYSTGNKAWLAKITGSDPKWKFKREFLNKQRNGLQITPLQEGDILEEVIFSHSGKGRSSDYYVVKDGHLSIITEKEVILYFL